MGGFTGRKSKTHFWRKLTHSRSDIITSTEKEDEGTGFPPHKSTRFTTSFTRFGGTFMEDQVCNLSIYVGKSITNLEGRHPNFCLLRWHPNKLKCSPTVAYKYPPRVVNACTHTHRSAYIYNDLCVNQNFNPSQGSSSFMVDSIEMRVIISRTESNVI